MTALSPFAADWIPWMVGLCIVSVVVFVLILIAPCMSVRVVGELDEEAQTRLLLGEDPEAIDRDLAARETERRSGVSELRRPDDD
jgi:hypothetical protein